MIWAIFAAMLLSAIALPLVPLLRANKATEGEDARKPALAVYEEQLREIQGEIDSGKIPAALGDEMRNEVKRRMLSLAESDGDHNAPGDGQERRKTVRIAGVVSAVLTFSLAILLYVDIGRPDLPSLEPVEDRPVNMAEAVGGDGSPSMEEVVQMLGDRLQSDPDNAEGWTLYARSLWQIGRAGDAAAAFGRAARLTPGNANLFASQGEALVDAMGGRVSPVARVALVEASKLDPAHPAPPYYLGLGLLQDGDAAGALVLWRGLEGRSPPDSPWLPTLRMQIAQAEVLTGEALESGSQTATGEAPEISSEDAATVESMSDTEQAQFIDAMVARLENRLEESPDDLDGWLRLTRAYRVLGRDQDASAALERAFALATDEEKARLAEEFLQ